MTDTNNPTPKIHGNPSCERCGIQLIDSEIKPRPVADQTGSFCNKCYTEYLKASQAYAMNGGLHVETPNHKY